MPAALPHTARALYMSYHMWLSRVVPAAAKSLVCSGVSEACAQRECPHQPSCQVMDDTLCS